MGRSAQAAVVGVLLSWGCLLAGPAKAGDQSLAELMQAYEAFAVRTEPVSAGMLGVREALGRLPDESLAAAQRNDAVLAELEKRAAGFDPARLDAEEALNLRLLQYQLANSRAAIRLDEARIPFLNDSGFHTTFEYLSRTPIRSTADAQAYLARLGGFARYYAQNIENARRGLKTRLVQPRLVVERVLAVAKAQAARQPAEDPLLAPLAEATLPEAQRQEFVNQAQMLLAGPIAQARADFVAFLEREYLPKAKTTFAARDWPKGEDYYRHLVALHTTTSLSPDQVHALGLAEVARIRARMEQVIAEVAFKGSFAEFLAFLRNDGQFYAPSREALLKEAAEISKRADGKLPGLFATLPRLPYGVLPVPQDQEEGYTTGRYWPGSPALGVAGNYIVNTGNLRARPLYELPALTVHEAVPGHHLQIALSQELGEDQPWHRRTGSFTAFTEGWGLYAEFLGEEMGIYRTPYERFGRLSYEMWRACRLVADTGLHWKRWSLEEAGRCFRENSALAEHNITTELERYVAWPGQALGYKIGEIRLRELRAKATAALGERFDVRRFHDAVPLAGPLPLDVLSARIDAWIAEEQAR